MNDFYRKAAEIIKSINYITIATATKDGTPWNTPVSATFDSSLNFYWGSSPNAVHSKNILENPEVFVVIFDNHQLEGTGVGVYMRGRAKSDELENIDITRYIFAPEQVWVNDEEKDKEGQYRYDIRIPLDINKLIEYFK